MLTSIILMLALLISPAWAVNPDDAEKFLENRFSPDVQERLLDAVKQNVNTSSWLVSCEGVVYSLSAVPVRKDDSPSMQNSLNLAALRHASMKAALNLAMYLDDGTKDSSDKEIMFTQYESQNRFSSASKIIGNNAFSVVWSENKADSVSEDEIVQEKSKL